MRRIALLALVAMACLGSITVPVQAQIPTTATSTILTGDQYDLYPVTLSAGQQVAATLVCDFDGLGRPLDPVLSVFYPGNAGTDDTVNADEYNDDGFSTAADPDGVDCDAFGSSRILFVPPVDGVYTFRADGFGSSVGPYTLSVFGQPGLLEIPTLDTVGLVSLAVLLAAGSLLLLRRRRSA